MTSQSGIESRVYNLEMTVAEHEAKLDAVCASLNRVVEKLDEVCDKLSRVLGAEAARAKIIDMAVGAAIAVVAEFVINKI